MNQHSLQLVAWAELALCWFAWLLASVRSRGKGPKPIIALSAPGAWLGISLNIIGLSCLAVPYHPQGFQSSILILVPAMVIAPLSVRLVWKAQRHLGPHWHAGAVVNEDHVLIQTGPYKSIRHPIYASLLGMVFATGGVYTWWPFFVAGAILNLFGIEIRARAEERLLERFFQDEFIEYHSRSRAFFRF